MCGFLLRNYAVQKRRSHKGCGESQCIQPENKRQSIRLNAIQKFKKEITKCQQERQGQWTKGKSCDTFGPIGPWLVTADEVADPQDLLEGKKGSGETVVVTSTKAISTYRQMEPTGKGGLQDPGNAGTGGGGN